MDKRVKSQAGKNLSRIMAQSYMQDLERASQGAFVVWMAIMVPAEILAGFPNLVFAIPESHAAMTAGKGLGPIQCEKAEARGYSMDLCSYARIDMGSVFDNGKDSPVGGLPRPDLLISNTNNCALLVKWFNVYERRFSIPHFTLDVPFCYESQTRDHHTYIRNQYLELIDLIQRMSGQTFDPDAAAQAVAHTTQALVHWKDFLSHARHRPSGITAFDSFVQMAPFLTLRGRQELVDHYALLAQETRERVAHGKFPVPNEKYRLFWDNIAPWHQLSTMSSRLARLDANIVGASYTACMGSVEGSFNLFPYENTDPLDYLARTQNATVCPHGMALRKKSMDQAVEELEIDGIVFASNRSCKVYSITQMDQMRMARVPSVMVEVDHADARQYNEEGVFLRIEALLEKIEGKRGNPSPQGS
ncbi:MAG: 2-hydroxyacyl-CoA dehydratase family protein [Desulfobacterales bacterium]|nr:2-hydroxyacyl-CoA dehydratase family protein [Desulfobacterales bacterium]